MDITTDSALFNYLSWSVCLLTHTRIQSLSFEYFLRFFTDLNHLTTISPRFEALLAQTGEFRSFWEENLISRQKELILIPFHPPWA